MKITFNSLCGEKIEYDEQRVVQSILICRKCGEEKVLERHRVRLFRYLSKIIVKNINNFAFLTCEYERELVFTKNDLISECYIVLEKCICSFDLRKKKSFYWFYNKALSRHLLRLIERNCRKHIKDIGIDLVKTSVNGITTTSEIDFLNYYLNKIDFTDEEKKLIESRLSMVKLNDYVKKVVGMNGSRYYQLLQSVKQKITKFYEQDHQNIDG